MNRTAAIPALLLLIASAVGQSAPSASAATPNQAAPAQAAAGQTAAAPEGSPAPIKNPITTSLKEIYPTRRQNTIAAVEAMPEDKFNYKPTPAQNTFAHLVAHMVDANYALCGGAAAVASPSFDKVSEWTPKDKLLTALKTSFDFCNDAFGKMDDSRLGELVVGPNDQQVSRARFALGVASNWADHYAEAAMYLRLNGIMPPTAKK